MILNVWGKGVERRWMVGEALVERPVCSVWAGEVLGFRADADQARVLDGEGRRVLLCCTRQWGKTTVTAVRVLYEMWFRPGTLVAVVSVTKRQARFLVAKVARLAREKLGVRVRRDERVGAGDGLSVRLPNGSAVVGLPANEDTTRGLIGGGLSDIGRGVAGEGRGVSRDAAVSGDDAGAVVGDVDAERGGGVFLRRMARGGEEWTRVKVTGPECGRIPADFLAEERRSLGEHRYKQEYLCEFVASRGQLVPRAVFDAAVAEEEEALDVAALFEREKR